MHSLAVFAVQCVVHPPLPAQAAKNSGPPCSLFPLTPTFVCPTQGLFSATLTVDVKLLVRAGLRHPITITIQEKGQKEGHVATPPALHNYYLVRHLPCASGYCLPHV